ncbi:MAG TPA: hypothetical protein VHR86_03190 [Armatimonadota bacterium]|nr:hypothetical protein [Armatimonadota bacterium]
MALDWTHTPWDLDSLSVEFIDDNAAIIRYGKVGAYPGCLKLVQLNHWERLRRVILEVKIATVFHALEQKLQAQNEQIRVMNNRR